eukprot:Seg11.2 transcript_id=Seg11.2/GoldUCD/mRNA.D3Y31 product="Cilia- and flagella-associated protein 161" protein_id=Seg11.2/GoldUCD/D3Y31
MGTTSHHVSMVTASIRKAYRVGERRQNRARKMSGISTYNPSVRVGNWSEDLYLEEHLLKDFLEKKENGELLIDKTHSLITKIQKKVDITCSNDGYLRFGDLVCLYNPELDAVLSVHMSDSKLHEAKCIEGPCGVSASKRLQPNARNVYVITSCDDSKVGDHLLMGQPFFLSTLPGIGGELKLQSDTFAFTKCAKKSRLQEVQLKNEASYPAKWQILYFDPRERMETEGLPVQANQKILINHCKTNQRLAVLPQFNFRTAFGREFEVAAKTQLDSHRAEQPTNHWILVTRSPGDDADD